MSDLKVINAQQAYDLLAEVVEGREDYVYYRENGCGTACVYFDNLKPSCVVGHVLDKLGIGYGDIWSHNSSAVLTIAGPLKILGFALTPKAVDVLFAAQTMQDAANNPEDTDHSWGAALENAAEVLSCSKSDDE